MPVSAPTNDTVKPPEFKVGNNRSLEEANAWTRLYREEPLEPELPIIDAHHHMWDDQRGRYALNEYVQDIESSGHNILATVFVQAGSMYRADGPDALKPVGEVEWVNGIAAMSASGRYGRTRVCAGIVGHADLTRGADVQPVLEALVAAGNGRLRGIRHGVAWDSGGARSGRNPMPRYLMLDPKFRQGFAVLQSLGLSYDAWQFYPQLADLVDLLREYPESTVVMNHLGGILGIPPHDGRRAEVFEIWRGHLRELAQFPNFNIKVGGLGMLYSGWDFHLQDMPPSSQALCAKWRPYVEACIEVLGPAKCMMEASFPADKQSCGYGVAWNTLKRITHGYSASEKAALYRDTAARVYRLSV